ncbi:hypothetical protein [Cytobacillus oceanisediminis]|uniref:NERD domain-containing protein n=1 Tax=Cytobacillus oceanisediminis TaxID=665099 RepID=A0ABX3CJM8_9BACI|nr:hypothetical protein [Cytobacillus oceanisediminis]OHX38860.1 hypothetical protein BBV17_04965 [Cytobacillus oceanisediminis]
MGNKRKLKRKRHNNKRAKAGLRKNKTTAKKRYKSIRSIPDMIQPPNYIISESPVKNFSQEQINKLISSVATDSTQTYNNKLQELIDIIRPIEPSSLLAHFSMYFLTNSQNHYLPDAEHILHQYHIELLQALTLQVKMEERDYKRIPIPLPDEIDKIVDLLKEITSSYNLMRLKTASDSSEKEKNEYLIIEQMRNHTVAVRNWAYPIQVINIIKELFNSVEEDIYEKIGIRISSIVDMIINVQEEIVEQINDYHSKISSVISAKTIPEAIDKYLSAYPHIKSTKQDLLKLASKFPSKDSYINNVFLKHSQLFIANMFTFSLEDFIRLYPENISDVDNFELILDSLSIKFGELAEYRYDILLANPVWDQPLIKVSKNNYLLPIPSLIYEFGIKMMERVIKPYKDIHKKYINNRGYILENLIEQLFLKSFPEAKIFKGSVWKEQKTDEYENDLVIIIDSYAIVVEAKSGNINDAAKRGAIKTLTREVKELLIEPSIQANRFKSLLEKNLGSKLILKTRKGTENNIDLSNVQRVITLSVTLELFVFGSNKYELYKAGLIKEKDLIVPSMTVSDLEAVLDLLDTSSEKIHYLIRREQFEKNANYFGDEHDLLSFYLKTGFNIGDSEFKEDHQLFLSGESEELSPYFLSKYGINDYTIDVKKPRPRRTRWFQTIIDHLEQRKTPGWTTMAQTLLNLSFEDQMAFEKGVNKIKRNVLNTNFHKLTNIDNMVIMLIGPHQRKDVLIGIAYKGLNKDERNDLINVHTSDILEETGNTYATVIGFDVESQHNPYSFLGLLSKG